MEPPPVQPLNYASPSTPRGRSFWVRPTFLWCFLCWFWIGVAFFIMPRFQTIFQDFKVELPLITRIGLSLCHLIAGGYGWIPLVVAPLFVPLFIPRAERRPPSAWLFLVAGYIALALSIVLMVMTTIMPMITLIGAVSGAPKR